MKSHRRRNRRQEEKRRDRRNNCGDGLHAARGFHGGNDNGERGERRYGARASTSFSRYPDFSMSDNRGFPTIESISRAAMLSALVLASCGKPERAPFAPAEALRGTHDAGPESGVLHIPPPTLPAEDAPGVCGRTKVPIVVDRPNFYFIVDASGSMLTPMDEPPVHGRIPSRYDSAQIAIYDLLLTVGHRVAYGAAVFPAAGASEKDVCPVGEAEVIFPTQIGDPPSYAAKGQAGPVLTGLLRAMAGRTPSGLTPTAATLAFLKSKLLALHGRTYAFLLTDGAPNCNSAASCTAATCTVNIEGACPQPPGSSCCDPQLGYDPRSCLDSDPTTRAVADLHDNGVQTFVIGMPGTEAYASLLDDLAVAGGTARDSAAKYYPVQNSSELTSTLEQIGLSVAISCDIPLGEVPPDRDEVNVYFDQDVVPLDDKNGWTWTGDDSIRIVGSSCDLLQTGRVFEVQAVAGCPSITR